MGMSIDGTQPPFYIFQVMIPSSIDVILYKRPKQQTDVYSYINITTFETLPHPERKDESNILFPVWLEKRARSIDREKQQHQATANRVVVGIYIYIRDLC